MSNRTLLLLLPVLLGATPALVTHNQSLGAPPTVDPDTPGLDQPTDAIWPAVNAWNPTLEREYSDFVHRLGQAVADHRCYRFDDCLRNPSANALYDRATDSHLFLGVDCADLPYLLR